MKEKSHLKKRSLTPEFHIRDVYQHVQKTINPIQIGVCYAHNVKVVTGTHITTFSYLNTVTASFVFHA